MHMKLKSKKNILIAVIILALIIALPGSVYAYNTYKSNYYAKSGQDLLEADKFDEAAALFKKSLDYNSKNRSLTEQKIEQIDKLKQSKEAFDAGMTLFNENKYLEAIEKFKLVSTEDNKRYELAITKIEESKSGYINANLTRAKAEGDKGKFESALAILDKNLLIDNANPETLALKEKYNGDLKKQKDEQAKAAEDEVRKIAEQNKKAANSQQSSSANIVLGNSDLNISLKSNSDRPNSMSLRYASFGLQPAGIYYSVVSGGFSEPLNYQITFKLRGRTATASGKTNQSQMSFMSATLVEVPRGEQIEIQITFEYNGQKFTTSGSRVINDSF